ncbi:hypothetical protein B0189_02075, partial [Moraxella cuniculi]|uniref:hypothetical protein n=1 Tax=Moraxella cuniculi TaxID=34061 RepID=UPI0009C46379
MKNIIVKINDAVQTVQEVNVVTNDGQPTVIKATKNVNYQFIDRATGRGPDHIVTKRVGQDLHISLEDEGKESDLIIEGFYDQDGAAALIGQAENGQYYYYVPDTGEVADYVTQLVPGDIEGQALGGESVVAPWWLGATQTKAAIWPWLLGGLLGAGAIAALANDDDDKSSNDNNSTTPVQPTPTPVASKPTVTPSTTDGSVSVNPGTGNNEVPITFTGEDNQPKKVTAKKDTQSNTWTLDDPNGTGATINPQTGEVTIPQDSVKDGEKVTAIGKETGKNDSEPVDGNAGTDSKNAEVDNSNNDGVVTTSVNEGEVQVTTVKLTNANGAELT